MADAQTTLLEIANEATTQGNRISVKMVDFLNSVKEAPLGFRNLGLDFLAVCKILNSLHGSLQAHFEAPQQQQRPFPAKATPELVKVLSQTLDDFAQLENLLDKFREYEKGGTFAMLQKTWRLVFADKDVGKISAHLQANKGALNMTMLLTDFDPVSAVAPVSHEQSMLATKLERQGSVAKSISTVGTSESSTSHVSGDILTPSVSEMSLSESRVVPPALPARRPTNETAPGPPVIDESAPEPGPIEETPVIDEAAPVPVPQEEASLEPGPKDIVEEEGHPGKVPLVTLVDRSKLVQKRVPKKKMSTTPASLTKTLISAVQSQKANIVEQLLERGISPDTTPDHSLVDAVWRSDIPILTLLLDFGADPNTKRHDDVTALRCACEHNLEPEAKLLLENGADPNQPSRDWIPITWALNHQTQESLVRLLLQYGADPNLTTHDGWTPLTYACEKNTSANVIQTIISYGADPNKKQGNGSTALQIACEHDQPEAVSALIAGGADPNLFGWDLPVYNARCNPLCMSALVAGGVDLTAYPGIMEKAVLSNSIETVKVLLDAGNDPNSRIENNWSPLTTAIRDNRLDILDLLLARGADPSAPGDGLPVTNAARCDDGEDCTRLKKVLDAGADINAQDGQNYGQTALMMACDRELIHNIKLLLERGADYDICDCDGKSAMERAADKGQEELVVMMLDSMEG